MTNSKQINIKTEKKKEVIVRKVENFEEVKWLTGC